MSCIKKSLTIIFALVLTLALLPSAVFAVGGEPDYVCYISDTNTGTNCFTTLENALASIEGKFEKPEQWAKIILNNDIILSKPLEINSHIVLELNGHSIIPPNVETLGITDVDVRRWSADAIAYVISRGIFSGNGDGTFEPTVTMTRSMTAQILYNMSGKPETDIRLPFTDADSLLWFTDAVSWAYNAGLVTGQPDGRFCGDDLITREQFMTILFRYAQMYGIDTSARSELTFDDAATVREYSREAMEWAVASGLINSDASGINPNTHVTREQIAFLLMRFTQLADLAKAV